jgi:NADPH2:quinone reductase
LRPFPIKPDAIYTLATIEQAYSAVLKSARDRLILRPIE